MTINFRYTGDNNEHKYAMLVCPGQYYQSQNTIEANAVLEFCPTENVSPYSLRIVDMNNQLLLLHHGPDYSKCVEAALLDSWIQFKIPAYAWRLYPLANALDFANDNHKESYENCRLDVCKIIWNLRMVSWNQVDLEIKSMFGPRGTDFTPIDAFAETDENAELFNSLSADQ